MATEYVNPEGLRLDGRRPLKMRQLHAVVGEVPSADGSALFNMSNTKVMAVVYQILVSVTRRVYDFMSMEPGKMQSKQADQAGVRLCLRLITLFILTVGRVGAVNVIGYNQRDACEGMARGCEAIAQDTCCAFAGLVPSSMSIGSKPPTGFAVAYTGNFNTHCLTSICTGGGEGTLCCIQSAYWGGSWYSIGQERQPSPGQSSCERSMEPNALFYTKGDTTWVVELASHEHAPMMELLETQDGATKLDWFRRNGKLIADANGSGYAVKIASQ